MPNEPADAVMADEKTMPVSNRAVTVYFTMGEVMGRFADAQGRDQETVDLPWP